MHAGSWVKVWDEAKIASFEYVVRAFSGRSGDGWIRNECPSCEEMDGTTDYKKSLGYNTRNGGFNCFKCGMKGSLPRKWRAKLELMDAHERVEVEARVGEVEAAENFVSLFEGDGLGAMSLDYARSYLLDEKPYGRGMSEDTAQAMKIGAALSGKLALRVIVPIFNYEDMRKPWRGWVARDYTGKSKLPYRYPRGMSREGLLFNESALWVETDEPVFVVEGVFDTTRLFPHAVACMGKPLSSHTAKLLQAKRPVVICLDGDAWEEGWALAMTLRHYGAKAGSIRLPPRTDPDEVEKVWLMSKAMSSLESAI